MKLQQLGYSPKLFGTYNLRSGGVTAADNADVPDHLSKQHDNWHSEGIC